MVELLRKLFEELSYGVIIFKLRDPSDPASLEFVFVNENASILRGADDPQDKLTDHIGQTIGEVYPEFVGTKLAKLFYNAIINQERFKIDQFDHSSEYISKVVYSSDIIPLSDDSVATIFQNITEKIEIENKLKQSERKYRKLIEDAPIAIVGQRGAKVAFVNNKYLQILGYDNESEILGNPITNYIIQSDREKIKQRALNRERGLEEPNIYETKLIKKDKTIIPVTFVISSIELEDGQINIAFVIDNTQIEILQQQLEMRHKMDSIGVLAAGIVHDFNNIFSVISMNLSLLNSYDSVTTDMQESINQSLLALQKGSKVINHLKSLTQHKITQYEAIDLYQIIEEVFELLKKTSDIVIDMDINFSKGEALLYGNETDFHQIFLNLTTNSIESIEEANPDNPKIEVDFHKKNDPEGELNYVITFTDNGLGIKQENLNKIFDPLYSTKKDIQKGIKRGFGLTTVYNLITNRYNGSIKTTSSNGVTFKLLFPTDDNTIEVPELNEVSADLKFHGTESILMIDDNELLCLSVKTAMEKLGYTIYIAYEGKEGLEIINDKEDKLDLILLDIIMPRISGKTLAHKIVKMYDIPILIITGYSSEIDIPEHLSVLSKPFEITELVEKVRDVFDTS